MGHLLLAVAASAMFATPPAIEEGVQDAADNRANVCLVTYSLETGNTGRNADVVRARYMPLRQARMFEAGHDSYSDIYTYGPDGFTGAGVDFHVPAPADADLGIDPAMTTQQVCAVLAQHGSLALRRSRGRLGG